MTILCMEKHSNCLLFPCILLHSFGGIRVNNTEVADRAVGQILRRNYVSFLVLIRGGILSEIEG